MAEFEIKAEDRNKLYEKLRKDPEFRELMKDSWEEAIKSLGVDPATLRGKQLKGHEVVPVDSGAVASSIIIVISRPTAQDSIEIEDKVVFD